MSNQGVKDLPLWNDAETNAKFTELCASEEISTDIIKELILIMRSHNHQQRARGINEEIDICLSGED